MSERVITDPSQHGWVEVDGKWVWDAESGGGAGAGMVISETEPTDKAEGMQWLNPTNGLVLFWDDEKWLQMPGGVDGADGADGADGLWTDNGGSISYSDGNVGIGTDSPSGIIEAKSSQPIIIIKDKDSTAQSTNYGILASQTSTGITAWDIGSRANDELRIAVRGATGVMTFHTSNGSNRERMRIDADGRVDITGSLYVNGTPKIGTKELIETLSTLRNATKDETTVKGLRDAIGNAVGGLIEKFEAMQEESGDE